jgi:hypothetical protein
MVDVLEMIDARIKLLTEQRAAVFTKIKARYHSNSIVVKFVRVLPKIPDLRIKVDQVFACIKLPRRMDSAKGDTQNR